MEIQSTFKGMMPPEGRHWRTDVETLEQWDTNGLIEWSKTGNPRKIILQTKKKAKGFKTFGNIKTLNTQLTQRKKSRHFRFSN